MQWLVCAALLGLFDADSVRPKRRDRAFVDIGLRFVPVHWGLFLV